MGFNVVLVGAQWGDEGKGKIVDVLAEYFDIVTRYQGGPNAGHTVIHKDKKLVLQLVPCGVMRPEKTSVLGSGVVFNPESFVKELDSLCRAGLEPGDRLRISSHAHLILPYHHAVEKAGEGARGRRKIGTTAKGIGPAYEDKMGRRGLRICDLSDPERFRAKYSEFIEDKRHMGAIPDSELDSFAEMADRYLELAPRILPYVTDTARFLNQEISKGRSVLFEGAQGTLLDVDHGTYPYVTSSNATAGGACTGTGVGPSRIHGVVGVTKAYATRVGNGPFPTEATDTSCKALRERGSEYGAVTGRPRRCGWFDVPATRYSLQVNGFDALIVTKLDVLDHLAEIPVGVRYEYNGETFDEMPNEAEILEEVKIQYKVMPGWQQSTFGLKEFAKLPSRAKDYLKFLEDQTGIEIALISTGPEREQIIWREKSGFCQALFQSATARLPAATS